MDIVKQVIDERIAKLQICSEYDEETNEINGAVEFDIENQAHFVDVVNSVFEDGYVHLVVDMGFVSYIDSSGLWALFEGHKKAAQRGGRLVLLNPTKDVRRVLDITKMSAKIQIYSSQVEAVSALFGR
ncbi:anti-sigma factor antagonist [bacterium]|nr:anti-sigma factor antagonist [bacterium]